MAASSAHNGRTSDCGAASVAGIVYVCCWELRRAYIYIVWPVGQGWGRRSARVAASSAHSGQTSHCGSTSDGIVYVCARLPLTVQARPATSG